MFRDVCLTSSVANTRILMLSLKYMYIQSRENAPATGLNFELLLNNRCSACWCLIFMEISVKIGVSNSGRGSSCQSPGLNCSFGPLLGRGGARITMRNLSADSLRLAAISRPTLGKRRQNWVHSCCIINLGNPFNNVVIV